MGKIILNLTVTFFVVGLGCLVIDDNLAGERKANDQKILTDQKKEIPTDDYEKPPARNKIWITLSYISFVLSGLILFIGCLYVHKTGEFVKGWSVGEIGSVESSGGGDGGDGGDGGGGGE